MARGGDDDDHAGDRPGLFGVDRVRCVAAIFCAATVVDARVLPASEQQVVVWTTIARVITSIVVHGLSAAPLTDKLLGPGATDP